MFDLSADGHYQLFMVIFNGCKGCLVSTVSSILVLLWYVKEEMGSSHSNLPLAWLKVCRDVTSADTAPEPSETQTVSQERGGLRTTSSPPSSIIQVAFFLTLLPCEGHHKLVLWKHHNIYRISAIKCHLSYVGTFLIQCFSLFLHYRFFSSLIKKWNLQ